MQELQGKRLRSVGQRRLLQGFVTSVAVYALAVSGGEAFAQETGVHANEPSAQSSLKDSAQTGQVQEIVVTATRQAQSLQKVPISVAAYTQKTLDDQQVKNIDDLSRITPGITFTRSAANGGEGTNIAIRGILSTAGAATTGIYIDDTPIQVRQAGGDANNAYPRVFDLERVEVLRGPQGTLFGAGSEGGAVRFITPQPDLKSYSAYGRAEVSSTEGGGPSGELGLAIGGPIVSDTLGFRVSGWFRRDGGYVDRVAYPSGGTIASDSNWTNSTVLRGALTWAPAPGLKITPSFLYQNVHMNDASTYWEQFSDASKSRFENAAAIRQPDSDHYELPALRAELAIGGIRLVSNTSYLWRDDSGVKDYTTFDPAAITFGSPNPVYYPLPGAFAPSTYQAKQNVFTQEIRLESANPNARLNYVFGIFYQSSRLSTGQSVQDNFVDQAIAAAYGPGVTELDILGLPLLPGGYTFVDWLKTDDKQIAAFGQVDWRLTPALKLTVGVRVARTKFTSDQVADGPANGGPSDTPGVERETPVTPKFGISYEIAPHNMVYASAAKGFRVGGANSPVPTSLCGSSLATFGYSSVPGTYKSDSVWSYELGSKNRFLGNRLQVDASVFHINWNNIQALVPLQCGFVFTANLGKATSDGFDLALQARISKELSVGGSVGYTHAVYSKSIVGSSNAAGVPVSYAIHKGDPTGAPPWTVNVYGEYQRPLGDRYEGFLHFDYQYSSHQPNPYNSQDGSYDPAIPGQPAVTNLNLRAGVRFNRTEVALFATNLTNDLPETNRSHDNILSPLFKGITVRPRTIGLSANFRY